MQPDFGPYASYLQALLPIVGALLQYQRADSTKPDSHTFGWAAFAAVGIYLLCFDWAHIPHGVAAVQGEVLKSALWFGTQGLPAVLGGTFVASKYASATGGTKGIPITNSK